jgi:ATP-grasp domain
MIAEVKGARLLPGFRGQPAADLDALEDTLVRVSHLAMHMEGHFAELDINPLMVPPWSEGGRCPRRVSRHIALHVAECLPQKSPSSIIGRNGPLSNPTPAVEPRRREPLNLPRSCHSFNVAFGRF